MNLLIHFALASLSLTAPQPAKWRVVLPSGHIVVAPTRELARDKAVRLAALEHSQPEEPKLDTLTPSFDRRHVEEATAELLSRLEALSTLAQSDDAGVRAPAKEAIDRYLSQPAPASTAIQSLNAGLEQAARETVVADLADNTAPTNVEGAALFGEPASMSDFTAIPAQLRPAYVALLERLEGLRPMTPAQAATFRRDSRLSVLLPSGAAVRLQASATPNRTGLRLAVAFVARKGDQRTMAVLVDQWLLKKGVYVLSSSKADPAQVIDYSAIATTRIVELAKADYAKIQARHEKQRIAADQRLEEQTTADQREKARLAQQEADRQAEQQRKDLEEQQRKAAEERRQLVEQCRHDLDETLRDIDRARQAHDDAERDLSLARDEKRDAERDADQARQRKDDLAGKVRDAEQKLEEAKRDGKGTHALENVVSELKDQLRGAEQEYDRAHDRVDSAERRIQSNRSTMDDLDSQVRKLQSEADDLRSKIANLGG